MNMIKRSNVVVELLSWFHINEALPKTEKLEELKQKILAMDNPENEKFLFENGYYQTNELKYLAENLHENWTKENLDDFDHFLEIGQAFRFLKWRISGLTMIRNDWGKKEILKPIVETIAAIVKDEEYNISEIAKNLEGSIIQDDRYYFFVNSVAKKLKKGSAAYAHVFESDNQYDAFEHLLEEEAECCCAIDSPTLIKKIQQNSSKIAEEFKTYKTFDERGGNYWYMPFKKQKYAF